MQASFQKWTDNSITKTINMPMAVTSEDIKEAYILAWKLGCKGLTVYRDKTKKDQVIEFGSNLSTDGKKKEYKCPTCDIKLTRENKCLKCKHKWMAIPGPDTACPKCKGIKVKWLSFNKTFAKLSLQHLIKLGGMCPACKFEGKVEDDCLCRE